MSAQTLVVGVGQLLVGWAMAVPSFMADPRTAVVWLRGWRAHLVIGGASIAAGLASLVVGTSVGLLRPTAGGSRLWLDCQGMSARGCCDLARFPLAVCRYSLTHTIQGLPVRDGR